MKERNYIILPAYFQLNALGLIHSVMVLFICSKRVSLY